MPSSPNPDIVNWLYHFWYGYLVPSLWGNGPEALAQTIVYGLIAIAVIPPLRKRAEAFAKRHMGDLHAKLDHHEALMAHIIKNHPDIPEFKEKK